VAISADERIELCTAVGDLLQETCTEHDVRRVMATDAGFDRDLWRKMADQGVIGMLIDDDYGGIGLGPVELEAVTEQTGAALLPSPFISSGVLAASVIHAGGSGEDKRRLLPGLADGSSIGTVAITGQRGTWTLEDIDVAADTDGTLSGHAHYVTFGQAADVILVVARTSNGPGVFEVAPDADGFTRRADAVFDATVPLSTYTFDRTHTRRLGCAGWEAVQHALDLTVVALAGEQVGGARRILDITVEYLKTRIQFGRPIGSFQALKHFAADLLLEVESATSAAQHAAAQIEPGEAGDPTATDGAIALAGFVCAETYENTALHAIQMHGGIGFTWEHPAHLFLRRARSGAQLFGGSRQHRERYLISKGA
jgi:alkylation response protein AidB-like acyl-CoA dehydrogenase